MLRRNGDDDQLLKPLEAMTSELRTAIRAYDPQIAAAALEREIHAIGGKIDGLAETTINPETFERILRQTEEVRNLLSAAANRSVPLEQFERRIGALADRVEALSASPAPQVECARMAASLAELRREIERSTPASALAAIEQRLEQIANRLDEALVARPHGGGADPAPFEDLARRIDDVRQSVEARPQPALDTSALEASLKELTARLDRPGVEPPVEAATPTIDLAPVEDALRSLNARLETGNPAALDPQIIDRVADEIVRRIETRGAAEPVLLSRQIGEIHSHLEALAERAMNPPESAVHAMIERLRESLVAPGAPGADGARLAAELSQMRAEQANAERQTQSRLGNLQEGFEKLLERLTSIESELSGDANDAGPARRSGSAVRTGPERADDPPAPDAFSGLGRQLPATAQTQADGESAAEPAIPEDFLLEPGAGAAELTREARDLAHAIGSRTSPSVSVHIAAARRAAQAAAETQKPSAGAPHGSLAERGASLYAAHRRSVLLAVALAILATVAIRLTGAHAPLQKSELDTPAKTAGTQTPVTAAPLAPVAQAPIAKPPEAPRPEITASAPPTVDPTPTASIGPAAKSKSAAPAATRLPPPDLLATLPSGLPTPLRDGVLAGAASAQYELAQRLLDGRGVTQDQNAAARWFEQAANAGFAPAQYRIAALYEKGIGAPKDLAIARNWYLSAAKAGNARAAHNLGVMAAEPQGGGSPDYAEAAKWFRHAGELGVRDSQYNLAVLYARGLGVDQDLRQSWMWFSLASAQGDADAARKRDEVAAKLDPAQLAAAADLLAGFRTQTPNPQANDPEPPSAGWDGKGPLKSGQSLAAPGPGQRARKVL